ncbi:MAG: hypothetical protein IKV41_02665 [Oscillospiraceae bacterium]|nr:hypothetical protein [Oscillospiraceae bacterium]
MQFCSLSFLYMFLPMSVMLFYAVPTHRRNLVLLAISLIFYSMADNMWLVVLLLSICFDYVMAGLLEDYKSSQKYSRIIFLIFAAKEILMIIWCDMMHQLRGMPIPVGLYVYTLTSLGYITDLYKGKIEKKDSIVDFALLCCFFGKIFAGPLVDGRDFIDQLNAKKRSLSTMGEGVVIFVRGFAKQAILAAGMHEVYEQLQMLNDGQITVLSVWLLMISYTFSLYYALSGFCDMARGLGKMFGLELPRNFYYPFQSRTVQDFFSRFNITYVEFLKKYVTNPLGREYGGFWTYASSTLLLNVLTGFWFGINLNNLAWGIYFTVFILIEKYVLFRWIPKIPPMFLRLYTFVIVMLSFTIFAGENLAQTAEYLNAMFGVGGMPFSNNSLLYIIAQHWAVILLSFIFATSITEKVNRFLNKYTPALSNVLSVVMNVMVLVTATALVV